MLPVVLALAGEYIAPEWLIESIMEPIPFRVSPYMALVFAVALVYTPFGLQLLYKMYLTKGKVDNMAPRKQSEQLKAMYPAFARLSAAEQNMQESMVIFAPALLAALQVCPPPCRGQAGTARDCVSYSGTMRLDGSDTESVMSRILTHIDTLQHTPANCRCQMPIGAYRCPELLQPRTSQGNHTGQRCCCAKDQQ